MDKREALEKYIKEEDIAHISQLLKSGIDLDILNSPVRILWYAISEGIKNEKVFELLFKYGARADNRLIGRVYRKTDYDERFLESLLQHKIYEKYDNNYPEYSALQEVGEYYCPNASVKCELMIKYGIDLHQPRGCMYTPLCLAVENNNISVIETMLKYGAEPLREYHSSIRAPSVPLEHSFSLRQKVVENLVKYAALQVDHADDEKMYKFFTYFKEANSRPYLKYAQSCMAEIEILKMINLNAKQISLFDFVISQQNKLESFLKDVEITRKVFNILYVTSLPIYKDVVLKKFERKDIPESLLENQCKESGAISKESECNDIPDSVVEGHCKDTDTTPKKSECKGLPEKFLEGRC